MCVPNEVISFLGICLNCLLTPSKGGGAIISHKPLSNKNNTFYKFMFLNIQYTQIFVVLLLVAMEIGHVPSRNLKSIWLEK